MKRFYFISFYYRNSFFKRGFCNSYFASKNPIDIRKTEEMIGDTFGHKIVIAISVNEITSEQYEEHKDEQAINCL